MSQGSRAMVFLPSCTHTYIFFSAFDSIGMALPLDAHITYPRIRYLGSTGIPKFTFHFFFSCLIIDNVKGNFVLHFYPLTTAIGLSFNAFLEIPAAWQVSTTSVTSL